VIPRRTLSAPVRVEGPGLFTGRPAGLTIEPSDRGGLRIALDDGDFPATIDRLDPRPVHPAFGAMPARCTTLSRDPASPPAHTVEHALGALAGLGVTDARLRLEGDEFPIGDGSALPFVPGILGVGLRDLPGEAPAIVIRERVELGGPDAGLVLEPFEGVEYRYHLDYPPGSPIPTQSASWDGSPASFVASIAPARTFCLRAEAEAMRRAGLFAHLSPREMLVLDTDGPIDNALRFPDEPARHKLLDLIGDLALAGGPIRGRITARRSGHAMNHDAARALARLRPGP
jgi:UDP-3-O-acyl-N-acetylglucosamine deacetylase